MFQYSFANTSLVCTMEYPGFNKKFKIEGFKAGEDLITIARKAPIATTDFSAYGDMVISLQRNLSVDVVIPLLQNSPENKYFQEFANYIQDQADKDGELIKPMQMNFVDNMGNDQALCLNGVILAIPALSRGLTVSTVTWVVSFEAGKIKRGHGRDYVTL